MCIAEFIIGSVKFQFASDKNNIFIWNGFDFWIICLLKCWWYYMNLYSIYIFLEFLLEWKNDIMWWSSLLFSELQSLQMGGYRGNQTVLNKQKETFILGGKTVSRNKDYKKRLSCVFFFQNRANCLFPMRSIVLSSVVKITIYMPWSLIPTIAIH